MTHHTSQDVPKSMPYGGKLYVRTNDACCECGEKRVYVGVALNVGRPFPVTPSWCDECEGE